MLVKSVVRLSAMMLAAPALFALGASPVDASPKTASTMGWTAITGGIDASCGLRANESLWCWGSDSSGQIGDGGSGSRVQPLPVRVAPGTTWGSVSVGDTHVCGVQTDGSLWCWGGNKNGQLGDGTRVTRLSPTRVGGATDWTTVSAGSQHTCAIKNDGTAWCWGANGTGALGNGTLDASRVPVEVMSNGLWESISAGYRHTCGVQTTGTAWCWGWNLDGQLGVGHTHRPFRTTTPRQLKGGGSWSPAVAAGFETSCGVQIDGSLWCWGNGYAGALGQGNQKSHVKPTRVGSDSDWSQVSIGYFHVCASMTSGALWCWGNNDDGEVGDGTKAARLSPVRVAPGAHWTTPGVGFLHSCAIRSNGTAWCWGYNHYGQLGNGSTSGSTLPVEVVKN